MIAAPLCSTASDYCESYTVNPESTSTFEVPTNEMDVTQAQAPTMPIFDVGSESFIHPNLSEAFAQIAKLKGLEEDWDSYGAEAMSESAITIAQNFLFKAQMQPEVAEALKYDDIRAQPSCVAPLNNGGVQLEWDGFNTAIEVEISPDGQFDYLFSKGRGSARKFTAVNEAQEADILKHICSVVVW